MNFIWNNLNKHSNRIDWWHSWECLCSNIFEWVFGRFQCSFRSRLQLWGHKCRLHNYMWVLNNANEVCELSADTQYFGWITKVQEHSGRGVCEAPTGLNQPLPWLRICRESVNLRHKAPCYRLTQVGRGCVSSPAGVDKSPAPCGETQDR